VVVVVCGFVTGEVMAVGGKEEEEFMGEESALPQPESKDITLAGLIKEGYFRYDFFLSCLVMLVNEVGGRRRGVSLVTPSSPSPKWKKTNLSLLVIVMTIGT